MLEPITEEMGIHKAWYEEASRMKMADLPAFLEKLTKNYEHDYGTICHAIGSAAVAAAWAVEREPCGGITGFQAGAVMWEFIQNWCSQYKDKPLKLLNYEDMLYPQYADRFDKLISASTHDYLMKEAAKKLEDADHAHPNVVAHWRALAAGAVPFGHRIKD